MSQIEDEAAILASYMPARIDIGRPVPSFWTGDERGWPQKFTRAYTEVEAFIIQQGQPVDSIAERERRTLAIALLMSLNEKMEGGEHEPWHPTTITRVMEKWLPCARHEMELDDLYLRMFDAAMREKLCSRGILAPPPNPGYGGFVVRPAGREEESNFLLPELLDLITYHHLDVAGRLELRSTCRFFYHRDTRVIKEFRPPRRWTKWLYAPVDNTIKSTPREIPELFHGFCTFLDLLMHTGLPHVRQTRIECQHLPLKHGWRLCIVWTKIWVTARSLVVRLHDLVLESAPYVLVDAMPSDSLFVRPLAAGFTLRELLVAAMPFLFQPMSPTEHENVKMTIQYKVERDPLAVLEQLDETWWLSSYRTEDRLYWHHCMNGGVYRRFFNPPRLID
jgi:hypothetical protein